MNKSYILLAILFSIQSFSQTIIATIDYQGYDETQAFFGQGEYEIFLDNIDGILDKPIIFLAGFDPGDTSSISDMYNSLNFNGDNLGDILRDEGFDPVALNFPLYNTNGTDIDGGADYIQRNAFVLIELINFINDQKIGDEELVVIGPSMGGLVARYALSFMEQNSMDHETRLYISFDSPHLGANIPVSFQYLINYLAEEQGNVEAQLAVDTVLNSPAAKEMLIDHYLGHLLAGSDFEQDPNLLLPVGAPDFREAFQSELDNLGFPQQIRNVSMINGSGQSIMTGTPGMQIIDTTLDLGNNVTADIILHFTPASSQTINVTDFDAFFNAIPIASFDAEAESFPSSDGLDSSPGGMSSISGSFDGGGNPIIIAFLEALEQDEFSFIPTLSALAIDNEDDWYVNPDIGGIHNSPFVNTFIPVGNEFHGTITSENADFALAEIRQEVLSVGDNLVNNKYKLVENPVIEQIKIRLNPSLSYNHIEAVIYSISGQQVWYKKFQNPTNEIILNHNLNSGIYILNILDSEVNYTIKIVVN